MGGEGRVLGLIPARAGSRRLPGKNLRPLAGRPMLDWTLDAALGATNLDAVVVSTDDPGVAALARARGVDVVDRPADLAGSEASVIDAVFHALGALGGDWAFVVLLQPTSPLRLASDIDGAVSLCRDRDAPSVIGVSTLAKPPGFHGQVADDGRYAPAADIAAALSVINGAVYVGRPDRLRAERTFQSEGALAWSMPAARGWDVDTIEEFAACDALLRARLSTEDQA